MTLELTMISSDAEAELRFDDPLALLAHASSRQFAEAEQMHDDLYAEGGSSSGDEPLPTWRERNRATTYHSYFRHCMFVVKPDVKHSYNPHLLGMVSDSLGARLHAHFMSTYNDAVDLLDPVLHTVDAIRASSALLATVVYLLAARAMPTADLPDGEDLCARLEAHINKVLLPAVLVEDLRSLELVQAFLLLSLYHPPTPRAYEDRSWSHIGHAIRIASSLSVASVLAHKKTIASHRHRSRHVRNYERTWYLLHIHEHFTSTFLARQFVLGDDATLAYAPQWVTEEVNLSLPGDRVIVKLLALKQLLHRSRAQDEVLLISKKSPIPTWKMQFNHRRSQAELSSWKAASVGGSGGEGRGDNLTAASETTASETCTELYYQYARVFLACLASKGSTASVEILSDMYDACLLFLSHLSNANVRYAPNVVYVTGAYVATIALRLSEMGHDFSAKDHLHVSVWNLVDKFRQAGNVTRYRDCCASAYANLVESLLKSSQRKRSIGENGEEQQNGTNGVHSQAPSQPSASSRSKATPTDCNATHGEVPSANLAQQLPFFGLDANFVSLIWTTSGVTSRWLTMLSSAFVIGQTNLLDPFLTDNLGAIHPDLM